MRLGHFCVFLTITICISCRSHEEKRVIAADEKCQTIIDSARVFVRTNDYAINYHPTIIDDERNLKLDKWLLKLSFKEVKCLLDNNDFSLKAIGFMYAMNENYDSLMANYSFLMNDKTKVKVYDVSGKVIRELPFGEFVVGLLDLKIEEDKDFSKKEELESEIVNFIQKYAAYPKTYVPYSFPMFSMGYDGNRVPNYKIHHEYELKNTAGELVNLTSAFVFDKTLKINVIEKDSTKFIYSYPPKLTNWLHEFGRKLSKEDSLELNLR